MCTLEMLQTPRYAMNIFLHVDICIQWVMLVQPYHSCNSRMADLKVLLGPHVDDFQGRVGQLDHMTWLESFGVDVIDVVRMEYARSTAVQNGLFAWGISKAETTPAISLSVS